MITYNESQLYVPKSKEGIKGIAKAVALQGFAVFPVRGKMPAISKEAGGNGVHDATTDHDEIDKWPACSGYGIAIPDDLVVIDIDPRNGGDAWFIENREKLPRTAMAWTGGGGVHIWYKRPEGLRFPGKLAPGVDTRQSGGYVVGPGSRHPSGKTYAWIGSNQPMADAPEWILQKARVALATMAEAERVEIDDLPEPLLTEAEHQAIAAAVEPGYIAGQKHDVAKNLGGWLKQRGLNAGDVAAVMDLLPSTEPDARLRGALAAFGIDHDFGYGELKYLLGDTAMATLEASTPDVAAERSASMTEQLDAAIKARQVPPPDAELDEIEGWLGERIDLTVPVPDEQYVIAGLPFVMGQVNAIVGYASNGKSPLTATLIAALATDTEWLGRDVIPGRVCALCFEDIAGATRALQRSLRALGALDNDNVHLFKVRTGDLNRVDQTIDYIETLRRYVVDGGFTHLVIDTYGSAIEGVDQNDSQYADAIKRLEIEGVNTLVLIHQRKGSEEPSLEAIAGTSALAGAIKGAIGIRRKEKGSSTFLVNWIRGGDFFETLPVEFRNIPGPNDVAGMSERWGLYVEQVELEAGDEDDRELTNEERQDLMASGLRTVVIPKMQAGNWRPTFDAIASTVGAQGSKDRDLLKKEVKRAIDNGLLTWQKDGAATVYYPIRRVGA